MLTVIIMALVGLAIGIYMKEKVKWLYILNIFKYIAICGMVGLLISLYIPTKNYVEVMTFNLSPIKDTSGNIFVGTGNVSNVDVYISYIKVNDSSNKMIVTEHSSTSINYTDSTPRLVVYTYKPYRDSFQNLFSNNPIKKRECIIHIPDGSIKKDFLMYVKW